MSVMSLLIYPDGHGTPCPYRQRMVTVKQKKIPVRQCVGCREHRPKRELVRVVRAPDGGISLDFRGKSPGRGAYVCPSMDCLQRAKKTKALERAFECPVPDEIFEKLTLEMKEAPVEQNP